MNAVKIYKYTNIVKKRNKKKLLGIKSKSQHGKHTLLVSLTGLVIPVSVWTRHYYSKCGIVN